MKKMAVLVLAMVLVLPLASGVAAPVTTDLTGYWSLTFQDGSSGYITFAQPHKDGSNNLVYPASLSVPKCGPPMALEVRGNTIGYPVYGVKFLCYIGGYAQYGGFRAQLATPSRMLDGTLLPLEQAKKEYRDRAGFSGLKDR